MMFHHPNAIWRDAQAKCMGLAHREISAKNENELDVLEKELSEMRIGGKQIDGVVSGAIASDYQKERIDAICERLRIRSFAPLWHTGERTLYEMVSNCEIYVVSVAAENLDEKWLGRRLDEKAIEEIKKIRPQVNPFFEGGEGETFVADAPFFSKRIAISEWETKWDGVRGVAEIKKAKLVEKKF